MKTDVKIFIGGNLMTISEAKAQGWILDYDIELLRLWGYYDTPASEEGNKKVRKEVSSTPDILKKSTRVRVGKTKRRVHHNKK